MCEEIQETEDLLASMPSGEVTEAEELPEQGTEADVDEADFEDGEE